jgi:hypothetical protein
MYKLCSILYRTLFSLFEIWYVGQVAPEVVSLLQRIQKIMNSNIVSAINTVFERIGFTIQKGVAVQLVPF